MVGRRPGKTRPRAGRNGGVPKVARCGWTAARPPNGPGWRPDAPMTWAPGPPPPPHTAAQTSHEPFEHHRCSVTHLAKIWVASLNKERYMMKAPLCAVEEIPEEGAKEVDFFGRPVRGL